MLIVNNPNINFFNFIINEFVKYLFANCAWKGESSQSARLANGLQTTTPTAELTSGSS